MIGPAASVLDVDLTAAAVTRWRIEPERWREEGGGGSTATRILLDSTRPGLDAYSAEALLIFARGAASGYDAVGLARCAVVAKSPATGGIGEARIEGTFPVALTRSGTDVLVIRGRAAEPCILVIGPDGARVEPTHLWGSGTRDTTEALRRRFGQDVSVAAIGPAGERRVRFASIVTDLAHPASRMGLGAVAGAKGLKAIVVLPGAPVEPADPQALAHLTAEYRDRIGSNPQTAQQHDVPGMGMWALDPVPGGYVTARNARTTRLPVLTVRDPSGGRRRAVTADAVDRVTGVAACPACPLDCIKTFRNAFDDRLAGLDEESLAAFAYQVDEHDLDALLDLVAESRDLGADPVSLAACVAFAIECAERGAQLPGGLHRRLTDGDASARRQVVRDLLRAVALRESPGSWLSDGVQHAAEYLAPVFRDAALHVLGLETSLWDPRPSAGQALATAVSPIGPRYEIVEHDIDFDPIDGPAHGIDQLERLGPWGWAPMQVLDDDRVDRTMLLLDLWSGLDAVGICVLAGPPVRELDLDGCAQLVAAVTGWAVTGDDVLKWGRRRLEVMQRFNDREGVLPGVLPARFHTEPLAGGRLSGARVDPERFTAAVTRYRALRVADRRRPHRDQETA